MSIYVSTNSKETLEHFQKSGIQPDYAKVELNVREIEKALKTHKEAVPKELDIESLLLNLKALPDGLDCTNYAEPFRYCVPLLEILTIKATGNCFVNPLRMQGNLFTHHMILVTNGLVFDRRFDIYEKPLIEYLQEIDKQNPLGIRCDKTLSTFTFGLPAGGSVFSWQLNRTCNRL